MARTRVKCPHCGRAYRVEETLLGKKARCARCRGLFRLGRHPDLPAFSSSPWPWLSQPPSTHPLSPRPAEPPERAPWQPGDLLLNLYEVREVFTSGGMGIVYRVRHRGWDVELAVKCPRPEFFRIEQDKENFEREAETWVKLAPYPHAVACYYVRRISGIPHVFAEFVRGGTLADALRTGRVGLGNPRDTLPRILDIAIQFAWGLDHAHQEGLVHRDVKPGNVLLSESGVVKVTDFGMARALGSTALAEGDAFVSAGGLTPAYCSPEQAFGESVARATDVWSWGVSLLEVFTGPATWSAGYLAAEVLEDYLRCAPPAGRPRMPEALAALLRQCFRRKATERPASLATVATELRTIYQEVAETPYPRAEPSATQDLPDALNNRAVSLLDLNKKEEAEALWEKALAANPGHPEATYNLGLCRWRDGRLADTELAARLGEVCASHAGEWRPAYLQACAYLEQGEWKRAAGSLEQITGAASRLDPVRAALTLARNRAEGGSRRVRTYEGHEDWVSSVSLAPGGALALSGGADRTLRLWEVATGRCLSVLHGHTDWVTAVVLGAEGRLALSGSADGTVRLWDAIAGEAQQVLTSPNNPGRAGGVIPLNSGTQGDNASRSPLLLGAPASGGAWVLSVALAESGHRAASGGADGLVSLWDLRTRQRLTTFAGHAGPVLAVALSTDGRWLLSGGRDGTVRLWDTETGTARSVLTGHTDKVHAVALSGDGRFALSASADRTLRYWNIEEGYCRSVLNGHEGAVLAACLNAEGTCALSASGDRTLRLWRLSQGRCLAVLEGHAAGVTAVALESSGRFAMSASGDRTLALWRLPWDVRAPYQLTRVQSSEALLAGWADYEQALAKSWQALMSGDAGTAARWIRTARECPGCTRQPEALERWGALYTRLPRVTLEGGWERLALEGHVGAVTALATDGRLLLSGGSDRTLRIWEIAGGTCLRVLDGEGSVTTAATVGRCGRRAVSGGADGFVRLWSLEEGRMLRAIEAHDEMVMVAAHFADGRRVLSAGADGTASLWDGDNGRRLCHVVVGSGPIHAAAPTPDGRHFVTGSGQFLIRSDGERLFTTGSLRLWDTENGRCLHDFAGSDGAVTALALSLDGRRLLTGSGRSVHDSRTGRSTPAAGSLFVWDVATGSLTISWVAHEGAVTAVCLTGDGRHALSAGTDRTVKVWETATGRCLRTFLGHADAVTCLALTPDGRYAISGGADRMLKVWLLDWQLDEREPGEWDEAAWPVVRAFLTGRRRVSGSGWSDEEFEELLETLGWSGYGWLKPESVRRRLKQE